MLLVVLSKTASLICFNYVLLSKLSYGFLLDVDIFDNEYNYYIGLLDNDKFHREFLVQIYGFLAI